MMLQSNALNNLIIYIYVYNMNAYMHVDMWFTSLYLLVHVESPLHNFTRR